VREQTSGLRAVAIIIGLGFAMLRGPIGIKPGGS
jgi:hypothetical protein